MMRAQDEIRQLIYMELRSATNLVLSEISKNTMCLQIVTKTDNFQKGMFFFKEQNQTATSLKCCKQGLRVPIDIEKSSILMNMLFMAINIIYYTLLVLIRPMILPLLL